MNKLIDKYFLFDGETDLLETLSIKEDVQDILPLNHFHSAWEASELASDVFILMKKTFDDGSEFTSLDIMKILLGISTDRVEWKMFSDSPYWGKYRDYDYEELVDKVEEVFKEKVGEVEYSSKRVKTN